MCPPMIAHWRQLTNRIELVHPSAHSSSQPKRQIDRFSRFWATVCKTVCRMLSDRCPVCPILSATLVYCGQTLGWIKMKLGMQVGLGPGHIVLDGDPAPPSPKGHSPKFSVHIRCRQWLDGLTCHSVWRWAFVLDVDPAYPSPNRGRSPHPNFRPMSVVAKQLDGSRSPLARRWALVQATLC